MSARDRQRLEAIRDDIALFERSFDDTDPKRGAHRAYVIFRERLDAPTLYGIEPSLHRARLLSMFFEGDETSPLRFGPPRGDAGGEPHLFVLYSLALSLNLTGGYPARAIALYERHLEIARDPENPPALAQCLGHYAKALRQAGRFRESESAAREGLTVIESKSEDPARDPKRGVNLYWLGMGLAHRGESAQSEACLDEAHRIFKSRTDLQSQGVVASFMAQRALWRARYDEAIRHAARAEEIGRTLEEDEAHADHHGAWKVLTAAIRMRGEALIQSGDVPEGEALVQDAYLKARRIDFVEEELPAARALGLGALRRDDLDAARLWIERTRIKAERGPFLLYAADSFNILAAIEARAGDRRAARAAAERALALSWCDGPPFAYERGRADAAERLAALARPPLSRDSARTRR
jgi:tetratricopeptide (TPR) repeat protein